MIIQLTKGAFAVIDDEDAMRDCIVKQYGCSCTNTCHAAAPIIPRRRTSWFAHFVTSLLLGILVASSAYIGLSRVEAAYQAEARV